MKHSLSLTDLGGTFLPDSRGSVLVVGAVPVLGPEHFDEEDLAVRYPDPFRVKNQKFESLVGSGFHFDSKVTQEMRARSKNPLSSARCPPRRTWNHLDSCRCDKCMRFYAAQRTYLAAEAVEAERQRHRGPKVIRRRLTDKIEEVQSAA